MKTLSGTFAFVVLAVIAIVTLSSCCRKQDSEALLTNEKFSLKIGKDRKDWAEVTTEADFMNALRVLCSHPGGICDVHFKNDKGDETHYPTCKDIETKKVTTSGAVHSASAGNANATYKVRSNNAADIENVLKTFGAPPTPTSTP